MIKNRLRQIMLEWSAQHGHRLTIRELTNKTGLAESTVIRMTQERQRLINYDTLEL